MIDEPYKYERNQPIVWYHKDLKKSNQFCLYCGAFVGVGALANSNKEHLIGRNFIPTDLQGDGKSFNFIFRACNHCNNEKSRWEDHLSATTLCKSPARDASPKIDSLAVKKAKNSFHPEQRKQSLDDSAEELNVDFKIGPAKITFGLIIPPQEAEEYLCLLATRHIQGIFSLITSPDPLTAEGTRLLPQLYVKVFRFYNQSDWGNPELVEVAKRVQDMPVFANVATTGRYFKAVLRRQYNPDSDCWFWALEWNKSLRIIGSIGPKQGLASYFKELPKTTFHYVGIHQGASCYLRSETPIGDIQDTLFD